MRFDAMMMKTIAAIVYLLMPMLGYQIAPSTGRIHPHQEVRIASKALSLLCSGCGKTVYCSSTPAAILIHAVRVHSCMHCYQNNQSLAFKNEYQTP